MKILFVGTGGFEPEIGWDDGLLALREGLSTLRWKTDFANVEYY